MGGRVLFVYPGIVTLHTNIQGMRSSGAPFRVVASGWGRESVDLRGWTPAIRSKLNHRPARSEDYDKKPRQAPVCSF